MSKNSLAFNLLILAAFGVIGLETSGYAQESALSQLPSEEKKVELINISPFGARVNPFLTFKEEEYFNDLGGAIPIGNLNLSAIFFSSAANKAIINGYVLEVGDNIDGKKVSDIQPDKVILKDSEGEYAVILKNIGDK